MERSPGRATAAGDGIDEAAWARLTVLVDAANHADARSYVAEIMGWGQNFGLPGQHRVSIYLSYLLGYRIKEILQNNKPTDTNLHDVAARIYPKVHQILDRVTETQIEEAIRIAFDRPAVGPGIAPAEFSWLAGAALGVLMTDPRAELSVIRPRLAAWWSRNYHSMLAQGLAE